MPLRFRRTIKIAPGVKLNLSKSGVSTTVGTKDIHFNFGKRGVKRTVTIPGTGISEIDYIKKNKSEAEKKRETKEEEAKEEHAEQRQADAVPVTGHAAARENVAAPPSTGLWVFFGLLAAVIFFFAGAAVFHLLPTHFFSNVFQWIAQVLRVAGH
jgi:hypothetical protein